MASYVFNNAKQLLSIGDLSFDNSESIYKLALMTDGVAGSQNESVWSDVKQYQIDPLTNTGYHTVKLSNLLVTKRNNTECVISADDESYNVSTISASYIVIVKSTTVGDTINDTDLLVEAIDIRINGQPVNSNNGVFSINLSYSNGGFLIIK